VEELPDGQELIFSGDEAEPLWEGAKRTDSGPEGPDRNSMGEYACAISHLHLWERLLEEGYESMCVFEDDSVIARPYDLRQLPADADFVFMNDSVSGLMPGELEGEEEDRWIAENPFVPLIPGCGTYSYIVTSKGAARGLEVMRPMRSPIDRQLLACGHGTEITEHSLLCCKPEGALTLAIYATTSIYATHEDHGESFLR